MEWNKTYGLASCRHYNHKTREQEKHLDNFLREQEKHLDNFLSDAS